MKSLIATVLIAGLTLAAPVAFAQNSGTVAGKKGSAMQAKRLTTGRGTRAMHKPVAPPSASKAQELSQGNISTSGGSPAADGGRSQGK